MKVTPLTNTPFQKILTTFLKAFENYYVPMPTDKAYYEQRWAAAKVDFGLSYGMFDGEKLVGFIIHAVDQRFGVRTAFNTGTGVLPEYRGQRIVNAIYQFAIDDLRKKGIEKSTLEVITKNERAIRAYQGVGFEISKEYKCYAGSIQSEQEAPVKLRKWSLHDYDWDKLPRQQHYSWDFQQETLLNANYDLYEVLHNDQPESYFISHPEKQYLAQFDVFIRGDEPWKRLFAAIGQVTEAVRIINVDTRLTDKIEWIQNLGLEITVDQYEMELGFA